MELVLTSEQNMLRDSAAKFADEAGAKVARRFRGQEPAFAPERLRQAGELGWLSILVPESAGGLGLGLTELAVVLHQAGRGLVCEPIGLAALSAFALSELQNSGEPHPLLARVMDGSLLIVPALQETAHGGGGTAPATRAEPSGAGVTLSGQKSFVCADGADGFLVSANGPDGPTLCHVARNAPGSSLVTMPTIEGRKLATLHLDGAPGEVVAVASNARDPVANIHDLALIALSAELLGLMDTAQAMTLDYLRIRKQFGKLIGSFQALQHKAVDNYIRIEATRSLVFQVAANSDPLNVDPALAAAVKAQASEAAMFVTKSCIQLHGAIGFTDEHDIGLYHKRAILYSSLLGDEARQRTRFSELTS
jgi:alkylation response protein AidB-like acyl-CoA dehydrogenase